MSDIANTALQEVIDGIAEAEGKQRRYLKYMNIATFINGGGQVDNDLFDYYQKLKNEFGPIEEEKAELTLEGACEVLNAKNHRGSSFWKISIGGTALGAHIEVLDLEGNPFETFHFLTAFEAVSIAEKYLREEK